VLFKFIWPIMEKKGKVMKILEDKRVFILFVS
jgi:hypothetical protein